MVFLIAISWVEQDMFGAKTFSIEEYVLFDKKHTHGMCHHPVIINIKKA